MRQILSIIQRPRELVAVICQRKLAGLQVLAAFHKPSPVGEELAAGLLELKKICAQNGCGKAWETGALVCMDAGQGVFHDFQLPTASLRMAKKAMPLLLESEFPFDPRDFEQKTIFFRRNSRQLGALVTLLPIRVMEQWRNALEQCNVPSARVFLSPWPIIGGIGKSGKTSLLVCLFGTGASLSALNERGLPLRINQFSVPAGPDAAELARELRLKCRMLLASFPFRPERVIFYGPGAPLSLRIHLEKEFQLPVFLAGEDLPLWKSHCRLAGNEPGWLVAIRMASLNLWAGRHISVFNLSIGQGWKQGIFDRFWLPAAACSILLCFLGVSIFLEALDRDARAEQLRALMLQELKKALPDAPGNAGVGRLRSIIGSRIANLEASGQNESAGIVLNLLDDIHAAVPAELDIDVRSLGLDDRHMRIYGRAGTYDDVNAMKEKLAGLGKLTGSRIVSAANRQDRERGNRPYVEFELDLSRGQ